MMHSVSILILIDTWSRIRDLSPHLTENFNLSLELTETFNLSLEVTETSDLSPDLIDTC